MSMFTEKTQPVHPAYASGVDLSALAAAINPIEMVGDDEPAVSLSGITQDSRLVVAGNVFVAVSGNEGDSHRYIHGAVARGAAVVICERKPALKGAASEGAAEDYGVPDYGVPTLVVRNSRHALADAAVCMFGAPTSELACVGLTGTNGKTTCARMLRHVIDAQRPPCGVIGTLGYQLGDLNQAGTHTSPEADVLQRVCREYVEGGAGFLVLEVSSIGLEHDRTRGVDFDVVAFTNFTQDHLDWHGSMERYAAAKRRLFFEYDYRRAVINVDDAFGRALVDRLPRKRVLTVSRDEDMDADVALISQRPTERGYDLVIKVGRESVSVKLPMIGDHNIDNAAMVLGITRALGLDVEKAATSLEGLPDVPGRLERCDTDSDDIAVFVDYAHTADALKRSLEATRAFVAHRHPKARVICVFGCGGDRDRGKRPQMGEAASRLADVAIVTNDNPRSEAPAAIAEAIVAGVSAERRSVLKVELDREQAIYDAVLQAQPDDAVLVAGKGHETYQIIGCDVHDFDDRIVVRSALAKRRKKGHG